MNPYANTYQKQHIETASREQILIMLYEGAIRFLKVAKTALSENNVEKAHNHIIKTQRILLEFMSTLDADLGGEMAKNLFQLYEYLHYRLVQANFSKDASMIEEVLEHLQLLKETWENAIGIARNLETAPDEFLKEHAYSA